MTTEARAQPARDGEPQLRELAVSPAIGPLPPIHVVPAPRRARVRPVRRVSAWAARHRYRRKAGG